MRAHIKALDDRMAFLTNQLETATSEKNALVTKAEATQKRANLANRLINGLSSEGKRWKEDVGKLDEQMCLLVGDVLLSSSFVAYITPFSRQIRVRSATPSWTRSRGLQRFEEPRQQVRDHVLRVRPAALEADALRLGSSCHVGRAAHCGVA